MVKIVPNVILPHSITGYMNIVMENYQGEEEFPFLMSEIEMPYVDSVLDRYKLELINIAPKFHDRYMEYTVRRINNG